MTGGTHPSSLSPLLSGPSEGVGAMAASSGDLERVVERAGGRADPGGRADQGGGSNGGGAAGPQIYVRPIGEPEPEGRVAELQAGAVRAGQRAGELKKREPCGG